MRVLYEIRDRLNLGGLIFALEHLDKRSIDHPVRFDFGRFAPHGLHSYRGFHDHLAVGYAENDEVTLADFLDSLREAASGYVNFDGYRMGRDTPLWIANRGDTGDTVIIGATDDDHEVILHTTVMEEWLS